MRKIIHRYTVLLLTVLLVGTGIALADTDVVVLGDVNSDGSVNATDVTALVNYLHGSGAVNEVAADVNRDGDIDIADVTAINNIISNGTFDKGTASTLFFPATTVNKNYGDAAFKNQLVRSGSKGAITYESSAPGVATVNMTTGEVTIMGAGTATITATLADNGGISGTFASYTVNVAQATNSLTTTPVLASVTQEYTGSPVTLVTTEGAALFGSVEYSTTSATEGFSTTVPTATNAGDYTVWYRVPGTASYTAIDAVKLGTVTISKATMTGITATAYSAAYDGEAHGITVNGVPDGATVTYGTTEGTYDQSENPTYTDVAAARTVYFKVSKANYSDFTGSSTVTITQATNSFTTQPTITGWTYGADANAPTGAVVQFGTPTYKYSASADGEYGTYDAVVNGQAGTWYVKGFVEGTTNYAAATSDAVSFTIANATMTGITATAYNAAYDGEAHGITVTGVPDGATVTYGTTEGTYDQSENPTYTDVAAARTVYFKVSKANYSDFTGSSTVTITQATNSFTAQPTIAGWTYGESANAPTGGAVQFGTPTYKYSASADGEYGTYDAVVNGNAGTWYVKGFVEATTNYAAATSNAVSFTINKVAASVTTAPTGKTSLTYTGEAQKLVDATSAASTGGTLVYSKTKNGAYGAASTITETNAGTYSFWYKVLGDGNHDDSTPVEISGVVIGKAALSSLSVSMSGWTYGGTATSPSVSNNSGSGTVTYNYKVSTAPDNTYSATKPSNAGTYTVRASVAETANYNAGTATANFTIAKANGAATLSSSSVEFGTTTGNKIVTVSDNTGTVSASVPSGSGCEVGVSGTTITITRSSNAAFTATITVTIAESTNHNITTKTINVSGTAIHSAGDVESATMGSYMCAKIWTSASSGYYVVCTDKSTSATWYDACGYSDSQGGKTFTCGTKDQWAAIMSACGGTGYKYINSKCSSVTGWSNMSGYYWSSTESIYNTGSAQYFASTNWLSRGKDSNYYVRLVSAF